MNTWKNIFLWSLYDFANSIVAIVFFLYFAQWIVIDRNLPDIYFNLTFTISAMLLFLTAPFFGSLLDKSWRRITGLRYTTFLTAFLYVICALAAIYNKEITALIFFTLGLYSYLLTFTFYTPLLNDIARPEKRGLVSGIGITANYLGQFAGLLMVLPFSNGILNLFGSSARAETLLPSVIIFFILAIPMLVFFDEPKKNISEKMTFSSKLRELLTETRILISFSGVGLFLLAYFLFNDAILTASNNFPIFLEQVWHVPDLTKTYILLGVLITSAIGGFFSGYFADRFGHKKTLMIILFGWLIIFPIVGLMNNFTLFVISTTIMGFWFGSTWTVSRSVMSYLAPEGKHNLAFTYFGLAERASSFIGPIVWGLTVSGLIFMGSYRYRVAVLAITAFIAISIFILSKVKDDQK